MRRLDIIIFLSTLVLNIYCLNNGLAYLPPLGWNTWCTDDYCGLFDYCFEREIFEMADAMVSSGMKDLGYNYICLDDCWADHNRTGDGQLMGDRKRFPNGMKHVADYVHSKGLKFGLYTCAGTLTCKYSRPGSWDHFNQDATTFASWGIDFVKMDWCHHPPISQKEVYGMFRDSLNKTGRPMLFSLCGWGEESVWEWGMGVGNMWRVGKDHLPIWYGRQGIAGIIEHSANKSKYSGHYGWNDPDFLMTHLLPLTHRDSITEFSFWSLWQAPLIVATDIRHMTANKKLILLNKEVLAVDQDPNAIAGDIIANYSNGGQVWTKVLTAPTTTYAIILYNPNDRASIEVPLQWKQVTPSWSSTTKISVRDLWEHKDLGIFPQFSATVAPHAVVMIKASLVN